MKTACALGFFKKGAMFWDIQIRPQYSPAEVVKVERSVISGSPDVSRITTSHIEKQNHTLRILRRKFFAVRLVVAVPAGQGSVAGVGKKKWQRRRFDVAVAKVHVGFALMTRMEKTIKRRDAKAQRFNRQFEV